MHIATYAQKYGAWAAPIVFAKTKTAANASRVRRAPSESMNWRSAASAMRPPRSPRLIQCSQNALFTWFARTTSEASAAPSTSEAIPASS